MIRKLILVALALGALASVVLGVRNGMTCVDFHWESAALFLRGENPYQYFLDGRLYKGVCVDATQAPSTIAFILPFGFFEQVFAHRLWAFCNVLFTLVLLSFVRRLWFPENWFRAFVVGCVFVMGVSWRMTVGCGQSGVFSLMFLTMAYWLAERNRRLDWLWAGVLLAAGLFKYTVTVPLACIFVVGRKWRTLAVCALVHVVLTVALGAWTGTSPLTLVRQSVTVGRLLNPSGGFADLAGLCTQFGMADVQGVATVGYVVYGLLLVGVTAVFCWRATAEPLVVFSILALLANMICYHRMYDFVTLLFPLVALVAGRLSPRAAVASGVLIGWEFFALRLLKGSPLLGTLGIPVGVALHWLLLVLLMRESWCGRSSERGEAIRNLSQG